MLRFFLGMGSVLLFPLIAFEQDANYWTSNYGAGGFFTPGAVIAKNLDSGVLFYNPALLAYSNKDAASVSGTVYQFESFKIHNGAGTGYDLKSSGGSVNPLIASHTLTFNKRKRPFTFVYALLHKPVIGLLTSQRRDDVRNILDDAYSPGAESFIGQYSFQNTVSETSALISIGFKVTQKLAMGLTMEGFIRSQAYLLNYNSRVIVNDGNDTLFPTLVNVSEYYLNTNRQIGAKFKAGFAYDISNAHHLGILITSPLINISGSGSILSDNVINNLKLGPISVHLLANTKQDHLKSKWKIPFSVAAGYSYHYSKGQIYFAAEYFGKVGEYEVVTPVEKAFIRPDTTNPALAVSLLKLKDVRKSIFNFSIGASFNIKPTLTGYITGRTDFNYADRDLFKNDDGYIVNTANWDNYHFQVGANIIKKKFSLRTGLLFTYGKTDNYMQGINFDNPNEQNLLIGDLHTTRATHFLAGVMVSYIHTL